MDLLILSPHRDDAAFSCGLLIKRAVQAGLQVGIVNIFTRSDYAPFSDAEGLEAVTHLRYQEDLAFAGLHRQLGNSGIQLFDLDLLDAPLRRNIKFHKVLNRKWDDGKFRGECNSLAERLEQLAPARLTLAPLALGHHLDHGLTREAARACSGFACLGYYEDLPYAAWSEPDELVKQVGYSLMGSEVKETAVHLDGGSVWKEQVCMCYASQIELERAQQMAEYARQLGDRERLWLPAETPPEIRALLVDA